MLRRRKRSQSKSIHKFVDILYQFEKDHPDELCPPETDPQLVVDCLCDVFLGTDWYTSMPLNTKQVNTIILDHILSKHSKEFKHLVEEKRREWKKVKIIKEKNHGFETILHQP